VVYYRICDMKLKQTPAGADTLQEENETPEQDPGFFLPRDIKQNDTLKQKEGDMVQFITLRDLANLLGVSKVTVYKKHKKWQAEGLNAYNLDGSQRFLASDVMAWMNRKKRVFVSK
jgi:predicted DNA-binding transcriptional regulator AlpA